MTSETNRTPHRARVLLLAYCCSPYHGSEEGVGWNRAVGAARYYDTWVICEEKKFAPSIRRYLSAHGPIPGLEFVFVPERFWAPLLWRIPGAGYLSYNWWHRRALRVAKRLHAQHRFDLVHQVNCIGFREPGYLWKLDAPLVWGPLGGTQNYPWRFLIRAGLRGALVETSRNIVNWLQLRWRGRVSRVARRAAVVLAASTSVRRELAHMTDRDVGILCETGVCSIRPPVVRDRLPGEPLRLLWSGRLHPGKALFLLIEALALVGDRIPYQLRVLGNGYRRQQWQRLARRRGIDRHVEWLDVVPYEEVLEHYTWADLFAFTSLRDTTGTVVLEALAAGLPVICLDHQGAHDVITPDCGVKIPVKSPRQVVDDLAQAIVRLARAPAERMRLSQGALERARQYLWSQQGERMAAVYEEVLASAETIP